MKRKTVCFALCVPSKIADLLEECAVKLFNILKELTPNSEVKDHTVYFVGHSLGGTFAEVASVQHTAENCTAKCITFGAPRTLKFPKRLSGLDTLRDSSVRFAMKGDLIATPDCNDSKVMIGPLKQMWSMYMGNTDFEPLANHTVHLEFPNRDSYYWLQSHKLQSYLTALMEGPK
jgi:hypothetical protein